MLVGDVAGHGQEALERTNAIRAGLHACLEAGMSPSAALASIGERAAESNERLTTVVVAVHDPGAGTLTYSSAGHPPPILTGPGAHEPLTVASSPPLGIGRTGLRETSVPLRTGSVACLFTDGLLEARVGDGLFGRERLTAMVAELDPEEQADALLEFVVAAADEVPDDMAVFLIRPVSGRRGARPADRDRGARRGRPRARPRRALPRRLRGARRAGGGLARRGARRGGERRRRRSSK